MVGRGVVREGCQLGNDMGQALSVGAIIEAAMAEPRHRARVRALRRFEPQFSAELWRELVSRANAAMRSEPRVAAQFARLAGVVALAVGDLSGRLTALRTLAQASLLGGRFRVALKVLHAATALARTGDAAQAERAQLEVLRVQPLLHLERYEEARACAERSLVLFERLADATGQMRARMALADLAFRLDKPKEALAQYAAVDRLMPDGFPPRFRAALAANRGNALEARCRFRAADRHFERARELFLDAGCEHTVAQVDYNLAYARALRGEYDEALRRYARTEATFQRLGDERHLALLDLDRAEIHVNLNMAAEAERHAAAAEARFAGLGMRKEAALAAQFAGRAATLRGELEGAGTALARAADAFAALGLDERRVSCLVQLGLLAQRQDAREEAARLADEAEALLPVDTAPLLWASLGLLRARLDLDAGEPTRALHRTDTVRTALRRLHAPWLEIEAHWLAGRAYAARNDLEEGLLAFRRALEALERYRGGVPPDEYMSAFLDGRIELYAEAVALYLRAGRPQEAFEVAERGKARALVDLLAGTPRGTRRTLQAGRLHHLRERLNAVYQRLFRNPGGGAEAARRQATALEQELLQRVREARMQDPEAASLAAADAPGLDAVRADLEPGTTLLSYLVTEQELTIFVVTPDAFHVVQRPVPARELRRGLQRFRHHLAQLGRQGAVVDDLQLEATRANLAQLADQVLSPVREHLDGHRLVVIPHGLLHQLPFHALPWGDGWLADRYEVVYAPSAAVYGFCRRKRTGGAGAAAAVFGLPDADAPGIADEARAVAAALGTDALHLGEEATLEALRAASGARVLHLATHGMFRAEQPMLSSIRLADTWLNLYDIYGLELDAELVVLSTCESGTAGVTGGNEILGLTRGFLFAGARALLASQWRVDDATTTELMTSFYGAMERGCDAARALQEAMAAVRARHPHPYHWAAFFLTGRPPVGSRPTAPGRLPALERRHA